MTWTDLVTAKRVAPESASKQELDELREMVATNLNDSQVRGVSAQGRYEFAYNAARLVTTVLIRACGYRVVSKSGHHYYTFQALEVVDPAFAKMAVYFDSARSKRNDFSYDTPVAISDTEADDLVRSVIQFRQDAEAWVKSKYPALA